MSSLDKQAGASDSLGQNKTTLTDLFIWVGQNSCNVVVQIIRTVILAVMFLFKYMKKSAAPLRSEITSFALEIIKKPLAAAVKTIDNVDESTKKFSHRKKMFGAKRAVSMQWRESLLAIKRKGSPWASFVNIAFPAAAVAVLVMTVNHFAEADYVVAVEYDGEDMGIVMGDDVLSEAQKAVADRIEYYDTKGDYFVNATISIKPLSSGDTLLDQYALAEKMEARVAVQYAERSPESEADAVEEPELHGNKIIAYAVRVDGQFIGAVSEYDRIEKALDKLKEGYDDPSYVDVFFDKDVQYEIEEYVYPDAVISQDKIIDTLTGYESAPDYYEVVEGDNLWNIAQSKGMTVEEISSCYATYNGQVIEDLEHSILRVGTLIQLQSEVPYLQVEYQKEMNYKKVLEYETITIEDPDLPLGKVVLETEGKDGERQGKALVTYRDGAAVKKQVLTSVITEEPVSEIIRMGTGANTGSAAEFSTYKGSGEYCWPVDGGYISSYMGDGRGHKGIDIAAPLGTAIYAAASGTVIDAGTGWNSGYGNCLVIENDDGNTTVYAHQSELVAQLGDYVEKGQLIGYVGSTGDSTGNHLHFEVRKDGKYIDPCSYVGEGE
ncbi:MAG: LysM peptidoglycan-binding domain-containing M23 family metallopeptidase [Huintestinicola sp.]